MNKDSEKLGRWPSGDCKPIFELRSSPEDMQNRYGLQFARHKDDLDWFLASYLVDESIGPVVFQRYENSPTDGVIVYVDIGIETEDALSRLREIMGIRDDSVIWQTGANS